MMVDPAELPVESTPQARLLAAAGSLVSAASGVLETARAEAVFQRDVAAFKADPETAIAPCFEDLDQVADAIVNLHFALGEPESLTRLAEAAAAWIRGEE